MVALEMNRMWHGSWSCLATGITWEARGDVGDDGRDARGGAGDEAVEEVGRAAQGLPPEQKGVGAGRERRGVQRQEVEVDALDAWERREQRSEVVGLGVGHRREDGHDGAVDTAMAR
jgi:hypothetical protein